jgi:hypothetical protein
MAAIEEQSTKNRTLQRGIILTYSVQHIITTEAQLDVGMSAEGTARGPSIPLDSSQHKKV